MTGDIRALGDRLAESADALRSGRALEGKADALEAVLDYCRAAEIPDAALLALYDLLGELGDTQGREASDGNPKKPIKLAVDEGHAIAAVDLLMDSGMKLDAAARKVAREVPGLDLTGAQLTTLRSNVGKGRAREEVAQQRRSVIASAKENGLPPAEAAGALLGILRERCPAPKKGQ